MEIFYPADDFECFVQLVLFFTWACAARLGWHYADWILQVLKDFFHFLRQRFRRKKDR